MSKRLSILMTVYNEADFVEYAIEACLPHVDDLVIVEGAYRETIACGGAARSTDGTIEKIAHSISKVYPRGEISLTHSIYHLEANEKTDKDQRNVGLAKIKELNPDGWLLIIDGDEVYTKENLMMIRSFMKTMDSQSKKAAYFKSLTFVNNFQTYTEQEFPRLFKITPECQFVNDNFMIWEDATWCHPHILKLPYLRYHHYAFCKGNERFALKKDWWETRFEDKKDFEYDWYVNEDGEIWSPNHKVFKYTGKHPEIMKSHPMWKEDEEV